MTTETTTRTSGTVREYSIPQLQECLDANPWQPRVIIDPEADEALERSIDTIGLLHYPIARIHGDRLQLGSGHRRWAAIQRLHAAGRWEKTVTLDIRELSDEQMAVLALAENTERKNLDAVEELRAWQRILQEIPSMTQTKLAQAVHKDQSTISNGVRILELPASVLEAVSDGRLPIRAAREILCIKDQPAIIGDVLEECGDQEDFRTDSVVEAIHDALRQAGWLQITNTTRYGAGDVQFDMDAFLKEHKDRIREIPGFKSSWREGNKGLWIEDRQLFSDAQAAAIKAKRKAKGEPEPPKQPTFAAEQLNDKHLAQLAKQAGVTVAVDDADALPEELVKAGGTRAEPTKQEQYGYHHGGKYRSLDAAFLDTSDCGTCTKGATSAPSSR